MSPDTTTVGGVTTASDPRAGSFLRRFGVMVAIGVPGLVAVGLTTAGQLGSLPGLPELPTPLLVVLALVQPTILLLVAVAIGVSLAPRIGLDSYVHDWAGAGTPLWSRLRGDLPLAAGLGVLLVVASIVLDALFAPYVTAFLEAAAGDAGVTTLSGVLGSLPVRLLYGGVVEELLLRFGLLTLFAWVGWRLLGRRVEGPSRAVMWTAVVLAAVLFGVGHLPAAATVSPLTPALIVRTVGINAVLGVGFGWLYWRRSLEAAMVAHMTFHVVIVALTVGALVLT